MNEVTLFQKDGGWMARYSGPCREDIVYLFETDTLPTAYTKDIDLNTLVRTVKQGHPGYVVTVQIGS